MNRGFTLIEAIIYIALLGLIMTGAVATAYQLLSGAGSLATKNTAGEEGNFVLRKLDWALSSIDPAQPIVPLTGYGSTISFSRYNQALPDIKIAFRLNGTAVEMSENGGTSYLPLTTTNVKANELHFHYITSVGTGPAGIEASTTINGTVFSITRYIRK